MHWPGLSPISDEQYEQHTHINSPGRLLSLLVSSSDGDRFTRADALLVSSVSSVEINKARSYEIADMRCNERVIPIINGN